MDVFGTIVNAIAVGEYIYRTFEAMKTSDKETEMLLVSIRLQLHTLRRFLGGCRRYTAKTLNLTEMQLVADFCRILMPELKVIQMMALDYQASQSTESSLLDKARWAIFKKNELQNVSIQLSEWSSIFSEMFATFTNAEKDRIFGDLSDDDWNNQSMIEIVKAIQKNALDPEASAATHRALLKDKLKRARPMRPSEEFQGNWKFKNNEENEEDEEHWYDEFHKLRVPGEPMITVLQELGRNHDSICLLSELLQHANPLTMGLLRSPGYTEGWMTQGKAYRLLFELPGHLQWNRRAPIQDLQQILAKSTSNSGIPSLDERFTLARTVTTAVYYLHCVGFVHKAITPLAIRFLTPLDEQPVVDMGSTGADVIEHPNSDFDTIPEIPSKKRKLLKQPEEAKASKRLKFRLPWQSRQSVSTAHPHFAEEESPSQKTNFTKPPDAERKTLGYPFLMNFGHARLTRSRLSNDCVPFSDITSRSWFKICTHPDRTQNDDPDRVFYQMCYDKYSLGVLLLAIGCWKDLSKDVVVAESMPGWNRRLKQLKEYAEMRKNNGKGILGEEELWYTVVDIYGDAGEMDDPGDDLSDVERKKLELERRKSIRARLQEIARETLPASVGIMYRDIVLDCLSVEKEDPYTAESLMTDVLGKLWGIRVG